MPRIGLISHDESNRGSRIQVRSALLDTGWWEVQKNLENTWPGSDMVWFTNHEPIKFVTVQIKTVDDLMFSYFEGRIQRQLTDMIRTSQIRVLLVEGWAGRDPKTGGLRNAHGLVRSNPRNPESRPIPYTAYEKAISTLTGMAPGTFFLVHSPDTKYTIEWLSKIGPERFDNDEYSELDKVELPQKHASLAIRSLLGWDGLGVESIKKLLTRFETPFGILDALRKGDWFEVTGITTAQVKKALTVGNSKYTEEEKK